MYSQGRTPGLELTTVPTHHPTSALSSSLSSSIPLGLALRHYWPFSHHPSPHAAAQQMSITEPTWIPDLLLRNRDFFLLLPISLLLAPKVFSLPALSFFSQALRIQHTSPPFQNKMSTSKGHGNVHIQHSGIQNSQETARASTNQ